MNNVKGMIVDILQAIGMLLFIIIAIIMCFLVPILMFNSIFNMIETHNCNSLVEHGVYEDYKTCYLNEYSD